MPAAAAGRGHAGAHAGRCDGVDSNVGVSVTFQGQCRRVDRVGPRPAAVLGFYGITRITWPWGTMVHTVLGSTL